MKRGDSSFAVRLTVYYTLGWLACCVMMKGDKPWGSPLVFTMGLLGLATMWLLPGWLRRGWPWFRRAGRWARVWTTVAGLFLLWQVGIHGSLRALMCVLSERVRGELFLVIFFWVVNGAFFAVMLLLCLPLVWAIVRAREPGAPATRDCETASVGVESTPADDRRENAEADPRGA